MSLNIKAVTTTIKQVADIAMSNSGQKFICGTYSNGKPRSVVDAMRDEFVSPEDRAKWDKKKKKKKKNKKKKNHKMQISSDSKKEKKRSYLNRFFFC